MHSIMEMALGQWAKHGEIAEETKGGQWYEDVPERPPAAGAGGIIEQANTMQARNQRTVARHGLARSFMLCDHGVSRVQRTTREVGEYEHAHQLA